MRGQDKSSSRNKQWWRRNAASPAPGSISTKKDILRYRSGALNNHEQLQNMFPAKILCDVDGVDILCLASGGGQQSAVFGLLGAQVTVVDFSEKQLEGDRKAAAHYGFDVTTIQADMRDLSSSADSSFDLVYQAPSMAYIPDVGRVYAEVARVLRTGGYYRVAHTNPAIEFIEMSSWDGEGYRISVPTLYTRSSMARKVRSSFAIT